MTDQSDPTANPWVTHESTERYDNAWIRVVEHRVTTPGGSPGIYGTIHFKALALGVVPIEADGHVWLVGQYRYPLGVYSWEIIEGGGRFGENPPASAARELAEETGLVAAHWHALPLLHTSNSVTDETAVCFLAWGLTRGEAEPEDTERLALRRVPFSQALDMAMTGAITDAISVATLARLEILRRAGRLPAGCPELV